MAFTAERFLLLPIGAGAVPWDSATVAASRVLAGGSADDVLSARQDRGVFLYFGSYPIHAQDETSFDNSPTTEGTFAAGTGYADAEVITLSDGSTVTVDDTASGPPGPVSEFTVDSSTSTGALDGATLTQSSTTGSGTGFSLTLDEDNVTTSQTITFDLGASPPLINFIFLGGLELSGTGLAAEDVTIQWDSDDDSAFGSPTAWGSKLYPIRATGGAVARLDMTQPNLGLADAELPAIMAQGRLHSYFKAADMATGVQERYHRLTISHAATAATDQRAYLPIIQGGWGWQPDGAQWAPGSFSKPPVFRQNGEVLRKWVCPVQAVLEDAYHLKIYEWIIANGNKNRAVFWQDPDLDERFIQNCGLVQVLQIPASQIAGAYTSGSVPTSGSSESYSGQFVFVERFNDEKES